MLEFAFDSVGLHRVYAQCRVGNGASRRIMEKLGMREEGILRENVLARGCGGHPSSARFSLRNTPRRILDLQAIIDSSPIRADVAGRLAYKFPESLSRRHV